ncbi:MAG TPA: nitroreductase family deazaflavin-dependent oxidoreductase [Anaerolineae bacterium]|nr:nitroreductase family deazaflavin-dependent oxidoreductase [Anaerolineae bacterium]
MTPDPRLEEQIRQGFKYFNRFMLLMWRLGMGPLLNMGPVMAGRYMVITHTGRKSGQKHRTPVNYAEVDGEIYCTAGFGGVSDWYRNIIANPQVEVWLPDGWYAGVAEEVMHPEARLPLLRDVLIAGGFASYAAGVDPHKMTDEELDAATKDYKLIHIRRVAARTGQDGPGDLVWVWPLVVMILLPLVLFKRSDGRRSKGKCCK